jgi:hypothetical protein
MIHQPFVYLWKEKSTGLMYLGSRTKQNCHPQDGYICSSKYVKPLIQSSPDDWERSIVFYGTRDEVLFVERSILQSVDARNNPVFLNRSNSDGELKGVSGLPQSKQHIDKRLNSYNQNTSKKKTRFHLGKFGELHPTSKKILFNGCIYGSMLEAARATGINQKTISHWVNKSRDFYLRHKKFRHIESPPSWI